MGGLMKLQLLMQAATKAKLQNPGILADLNTGTKRSKATEPPGSPVKLPGAGTSDTEKIT